jgi:hypothetical protein
VDFERASMNAFVVSGLIKRRAELAGPRCLVGRKLEDNLPIFGILAALNGVH